MSQIRSGTPAVSLGQRPALAVVGAIAFVGLYFLVDVVHGAVATGDRPLPDDPDNVVYQYLTSDSTAVAANALVMLASMAGLLLFLVAVRRALPGTGSQTRWAQLFGLLAVAAMIVSVVLNLVLAAGASDMSVGTAVGLRDAGFVAGGVVHVMSLGAFVGLAGWTFAGRGLRVFGLVAAVPALLSVVSLVWFPAAALILLGRLLCMVWTLCAAGVLVRTQLRDRAAPATSAT